jgi:hypothetical protein
MMGFPLMGLSLHRGSFALDKRLVTLTKLAAYLDVPSESLLRLIEAEDNGDFPGIRIGDEWFVALEEVPEWLLRLAKA